MRNFECFSICCLVAMLRGYCFAFSAVFRETCDRREAARLLHSILQTRGQSLAAQVKWVQIPYLVLSRSLIRLTMYHKRFVDGENAGRCR